MNSPKVHYVVLRSGRTWGVYRQPASDGTGQELVEGGFFSKASALYALDAYTKGQA